MMLNFFHRQHWIVLLVICSLAVVQVSAANPGEAHQQTVFGALRWRLELKRQPIDVNLDGTDEVLSYLAVRSLLIKFYVVSLSYQDDTVWTVRLMDSGLILKPATLTLTLTRRLADRDFFWNAAFTPNAIEMFPQRDTHHRTYMIVKSYADLESYQMMVIRWDEWQPETVLDIYQIGCPQWQINEAGMLTITGLRPFPNQGCTVDVMEYVIEDAVFEQK